MVEQNLTHPKDDFWSYLSRPCHNVVVWDDWATGNMDPCFRSFFIMDLEQMQKSFKLPNPLVNFFSSHSTALANEGFVLSTSKHSFISSPKALRTSSLSSSISDRECTGAIPSQNTLQSFSSSHRHTMMGNTCFLRNGSWSEIDAMIASIEAL